MNTTKHFTTCQNETVELIKPYWEAGKYIGTEKGWLLVMTLDGVDSRTIAKKVRNCDLFAVGTCPKCGSRHFAERVIARLAQASNHKCDARCVHAKGRNCECACGGKNHGAN